jgi:hypothetical protein
MKMRKFKVSIGTIGLLVSTFSIGSEISGISNDNCDNIINKSICSNKEDCENVTMNDVLIELENNGCLNLGELKLMSRCGSCTSPCEKITP